MRLQDVVAILLVANGLPDFAVNIFPLVSHGLGAPQRIANLAIGRDLESDGAIRSQGIPAKRQIGFDSLGALSQEMDHFIASVLGHGGRNVDVPELSGALLLGIPQRCQRVADFSLATAGGAWGRTGVVVAIGRRIRPEDIIVGHGVMAAATAKPLSHIDSNEVFENRF
ncbi:hypothetical protein ACQUJS_16970 [Ralstonia pseudosolanacearum]|uniref:hypothetical protein n=1 Tax=Ralstonia pseudosolanacearum TaxID=1310165 RepID=UPI0012DA7ADC|nr:hypothetical protein [Ralstonia pseudosolanacearum]